MSALKCFNVFETWEFYWILVNLFNGYYVLKKSSTALLINDYFNKRVIVFTKQRNNTENHSGLVPNSGVSLIDLPACDELTTHL